MYLHIKDAIIMTFLPFKLTTASRLACLLLITAGYQSVASANPSYNQAISTATSTAATSTQQNLRSQALRIQHELSEHNYTTIVNDIHPTRGVRFSMYGRVVVASDKVFSRDQFAQYLDQSRIRFTWGQLDGTGDPLVIPLPEYLDTWVAAEDFDNTSVSVNEIEQYGIYTIKNLQTIYPLAEVVEFYYNGSDEYQGMDWRALRLVFETYQGRRYLVAIINDQWTI